MSATERQNNRIDVRRIPYVPVNESCSPLVCCLQCCVIACIILVIIGFLYFVFWLSRIIGQGEKLSVPNHNKTGEKMLNFYETERLCNIYRRDLPHPQSQREEDLVIAEINSKIDAECEYVYFGYTADNTVRYQSPSGNATWASLRTMPDGVLPFDFEECYELRFTQSGPPNVTAAENCGNRTGRSLLFLTNNDTEFCRRRRYKCVDVYNSLPSDNVTTTFNLAKWRNSNLLQLLPFDKNQAPEISRLRDSVLLVAPVIVMATTYKFIYKYRNVVQPYTSNRFSVVDPEYDCLAYDIKRNRMITRDCDDKACPACANLADNYNADVNLSNFLVKR